MAIGLTAPENLVAISLETTGLNPLRGGITEVGAVRFDYEGKLLNSFWERTNPGVPVPEHVTRLTGIRDEMLEGARSPEEVARDLFAWAGPGAWFAAHSGEFEAAFLLAAGGPPEDDDSLMLSTLQWACSAGLDVPNHRLDTLMDLIGFEIRVRPMHSTLVGAQAVADLFRFLLRRSYPDPTHDGVKDMLIFRTDRMQALARRYAEQSSRRRQRA
jgi:DNA polymerase III epsilon subunit-like protein